MTTRNLQAFSVTAEGVAQLNTHLLALCAAQVASQRRPQPVHLQMTTRTRTLSLTHIRHVHAHPPCACA